MRESTHNLIHYLCMCLMAKRHGEALNDEEASKRIKNAVPKDQRLRSIKHNGVFVYLNPAWKSERTNDYGPAESCNFGLDVSVIESLKTDMLGPVHTSAFSFENAYISMRFGLPSTLIRSNTFSVFTAKTHRFENVVESENK